MTEGERGPLEDHSIWRILWLRARMNTRHYLATAELDSILFSVFIATLLLILLILAIVIAVSAIKYVT